MNNKIYFKFKSKNQIKIKFIVLGMAIYVFFACNLFSLLVFQRTPRINDEAAYNFQAKIFLSGRLTAPAPCSPAFFSFPHVVITKDKWFSQYPPGFPALLAIGHILHAPWIINPLLASLSIIIIFILGKDLFSAQTGLIASVLCSLSYWFIIMSSTMMSHTASLFFNLVFLLFFFKILNKPKFSLGLISGISFGLAFLVRPYNAVLFVFPFVIILVIHFFCRPRNNLKLLAAFCLPAFLAVIIFLCYNWATTGHLLKSGYLEKYGNRVLPGFGQHGLYSEKYTLFNAIDNAKENFIALNKHLFGWPISSFLGIIIFFIFLFKDKYNLKIKKKELLLFLPVITYFIGFFFYWGAFAFLGARMFFELVPIFVLLTSRGLEQSITYLNIKFKSHSLAITIIILFLVMLFVFSLISFIKHITYPNDFDSFWRVISPNFSKATIKVYKTIEKLGIQNAIILLKPIYFPLEPFPEHDWAAGFILNDPKLNNDIIYARARDGKFTSLFDCFASRKLYLFLFTVKKGIIFELQRIDGEIKIGPPLTFSRAHKVREDSLQLISEFKEFFYPYSPSFSLFLDEINKYPILEFDLPFLFSLGLQEQSKNNYQKAAYYFEACLQIETDAETRLIIVNKLLSCYLKLKDKSTFSSILNKINRSRSATLYNLCLEKGF